MKSDDIQRGIRTLHKRAAGSEPDIGRVSRMRGTGMPQGPRKRRRRGERSQDQRAVRARRRVILYRSILLGAATFALLGLVFAFWLLPNMGKKAGEKSMALQMDEPKVRVISKFEAPDERTALDLVKRALAVREPAKVNAFYRTGEASPAEVVEFLSGMAKSEGAIDRFDWLSGMDANEISLEGVLVTFKSPGKPRNRLALLTPDEQGVWKIDYPAFSRWMKPSWNELLDHPTGSAVARVYVGRDGYYNGIFKDDKTWVCVGIASPDTDELMLGYCKIGSPQEEALGRLLARGIQMCRATLEIRHLEGSERRQFEITRVLAQDWVMSDTALDERVK